MGFVPREASGHMRRMPVALGAKQHSCFELRVNVRDHINTDASGLSVAIGCLLSSALLSQILSSCLCDTKQHVPSLEAQTGVYTLTPAHWSQMLTFRQRRS